MKISEKVKEQKTRKIVLLSLMVVVVCLCVWGVWYINDSFRWNIEARYDECADEFNLIKDYILAEYPDEDDKIVWVNYDNDSDNYYFEDFDTNEVLKCDNKITEALKKLQEEAFCKKSLDSIRINGNRVAFCIEAGYYSITFSPHEKPEMVSGMDVDAEGVYIKKADENWYHVRSKKSCS